jgi:hypothetical protein
LKEEQYPQALKQLYMRVMGETLDLQNPKTFNEKIQWMKLYDSTQLKTMLADKYKVWQWAAGKIGEEYLIPLLGVWENADDIDFDSLPNKFVLKANHGCGWNIIVRDKSKLDIKKTRKQLNNWLKLNYAFVALELHYKNIRPVIIAEKYLENLGDILYDYKFLCFHDEPKYCSVEMGRGAAFRSSLFDLNYEPLPFSIGTFLKIDPPLAKPPNFDLMITLAKKLCQGFKHVRVDFFNVNGKIYFGEMTFTNHAGLVKIIPREYDTILGDMINLSA